MKTVFFVIDKALHGNVQAQEFLDMALMAAAFDQHVVLLFEGEGALALMKNQQPETLGLKNVTPILSALPIYDIKDIWVEKESMERWGMDASQLTIPAVSMPREAVKEQMYLADHVFSF